MRDTPPEVEERYRAMLMAKPGIDRLRMGAQMHEASRRLVMAGLRAQYPTADRHELRRRFLKRFYGDELSDDVIERVARASTRLPDDR